MKLLEINSVNYGSTGNIMREIASASKSEYLLAVAASKTNYNNNEGDCIFIGNRFSRNISLLLNKITGLNGSFNFISTLVFLQRIKTFKPDIIHIHNLHNSYINISMLFRYLKKSNIPVVWTFHDCWPITGRCPHFQITKCNNWIKECKKCRYSKKDYPSVLCNFNVKKMWNKKRCLFTEVKRLTIVTPSIWLKSVVKKSFFSDKNIEIINNGIDLCTFKYESNIEKKMEIFDGKSIILGVASTWSFSKGLDIFLELSHLLDNTFIIVLIGQVPFNKKLPSNIFHINRTEDKKELVKYYSLADVFVNPTREDTFPTVNIEALACGTPVVTFPTGGSPEIIDESCGTVVQTVNAKLMCNEIIRICRLKPFSKEACRRRAINYDKLEKYKEYQSLFNRLKSSSK